MPAPRDLTKTLQRSLAHLDVPARRKGGQHGMPIPSHFQPPGKKFVQSKDRIPYWNIAPGDRVKVVRGGADVKGKVGTIDQVFREHNKVTLKEVDFLSKKRTPSNYPGESLKPGFTGQDAVIQVPVPYHVSNVRLLVPFPEGKEYAATRLRRTPPTWDRQLKRFHWRRYGLVREQAADGSDPWYEIKWPVEDERLFGANDGMNADSKQSLEATFEPDLQALTIHASATRLDSVSLTVQPPPELTVSPIDLRGGPHSRAERTRRFNERKAEEKLHGKAMMAQAIDERVGRRRTAASVAHPTPAVELAE